MGKFLILVNAVICLFVVPIVYNKKERKRNKEIIADK
jgi:hypothetical protein